MIRQLIVVAGLLGGTAMAVAAPPKELAGHYYLRGVMETGSELLLKEDGSFDYFLAYGALDQLASGSWKQQGSQVVLEARVPEGDLFKPLPHALPPTDPEELKSYEAAMAQLRAEIGERWVVRIGNPESGMTLGNVKVTLQYPDGKQESVVTERSGEAAFKARKDAAPQRVGLDFQDDDKPVQWFDGGKPPLNSLLFDFDYRQLMPLPFKTMTLRIDGRDLIPHWPEEGERGRYSRD